MALIVTHVHHLLLRYGASIAAVQFKRTPQAWIFRAPTLWFLGPRPHYLVSETQKLKIETLFGASNCVSWLLLAAVGLMLFLWALSVPLRSVTTDLMLIFSLVSVGIWSAEFVSLFRASGTAENLTTYDSEDNIRRAARSGGGNAFHRLLGTSTDGAPCCVFSFCAWDNRG